MENQFSKRLKELLEVEKISQKDFAKKVGVSPSCVTFWLKAERQPTAENLYTVSKAFDVSVDYLLGLKEG